MVNKIWEKQDTCKVWLMVMPDAEKQKRKLSYKDINAKLEKLLNDKGIRITKASTITPKGIYHVGETSFSNKVQRAMDKKGVLPVGPSNMFFEMDYDYNEFKNIYGKIGRVQNNFPAYFATKEDFDNYRKTHDLIVIEDVKTNRPIGFMTRGIYPKDSESAKEFDADFGYKVRQDVLYMDTFALDSGAVAKGIGRDVSQAMDAFYLAQFTDKCEFILVTGDINQAKGGKLSRDNHTDRGFAVAGEITVPTEKYKNRYAGADMSLGNATLTTAASYRRAAVK